MKNTIVVVLLSICPPIFADTKNFLCIDEFESLRDQKFSINYGSREISMQDKRKIFDVDFKQNLVSFKKSLSIRNLDSLISRQPEYFVYIFDINKMNLLVSVSSEPEKKYKFNCMKMG